MNVSWGVTVWEGEGMRERVRWGHEKTNNNRLPMMIGDLLSRRVKRRHECVDGGKIRKRFTAAK